MSTNPWGRAVAKKTEQSPPAAQVASLSEADLGKPVTLFARVADLDTKTITVQVAVFKCGRCGRVGEEVQISEQLKFPLSCQPSWGGCGAKRSEARFKFLEKESLYAQRQAIVLADDEDELAKIQALLRGPLAGSIPMGAQATFRGKLKPRRGKLPRGELPFLLEVAEVTDVRMPDRVVVYPRRVDPQMVYNIIIELQRMGQPTNYKVVVAEALKIGLTEDDVRAMLNKLLSEGKLDSREAGNKRLKRGGGEGP
jgi:DNA replicative helicase MCM subunit Mcm2 (Cdc46/Mcm family)